jgi:hypothetical protein
MAEQGGGVPPGAIALVVCDSVYESTDGKRALVGLFTKISARQFPTVHGKLCVYVSVTNVKPATACKVEIVNGETDQTIVSAEGPMPDANDPLAIWDLVFEFRNLVFPEPGKYYVRFFGNDHLLLERPFQVDKLSAPNDKGKTK